MSALVFWWQSDSGSGSGVTEFASAISNLEFVDEFLMIRNQDFVTGFI